MATISGTRLAAILLTGGLKPDPRIWKLCGPALDAGLPVLTIPYDQYVASAPRLVAEILAEYPIAVVRGHGVYASADSLNLAYKWTCSLELSAKTAFIAQQAGKI